MLSRIDLLPRDHAVPHRADEEAPQGRGRLLIVAKKPHSEIVPGPSTRLDWLGLKGSVAVPARLRSDRRQRLTQEAVRRESTPGPGLLPGPIRGKAGAKPVQGRCKAGHEGGLHRLWIGVAAGLVRSSPELALCPIAPLPLRPTPGLAPEDPPRERTTGQPFGQFAALG